MNYRHLKPGEKIPGGLLRVAPYLESRLVWVAEQDGEIRGALIALGGHGIISPIGIIGHPKNHASWLVPFLTYFMRDASGLGYTVLLSALDESPGARTLGKIMRSRGATIHTESTWCVIPLSKLMHSVSIPIRKEEAPCQSVLR